MHGAWGIIPSLALLAKEIWGSGAFGIMWSKEKNE